jgi:hypothetical protein
VAWNVVNFFEHTEPGRVVAGARAAGNAPRVLDGINGRRLFEMH